jgi:hypothetical protein
MTYLALAHGAKGLIYYCYYDLRVLPQYDEMWGWMKRIAAEVKSLSPVLLAPDDLGRVAHSPASAPIHTKLKRSNGRLYLVAVNSGNDAIAVAFDLRRALSQPVQVMFENRAITPADRGFSDAFKPLEAHVYDLGVDARRR